MNILVTGANGQLGNEMRLVSLGSGDRYIFTDVVDASQESLEKLGVLAGGPVDTTTVRLDITDIDAVRAMARDENVDVIVNCAAFTNVDAAESNLPLATRLNAEAPENLARVMGERGGLLIHISTDYVFGGEVYDRPCDETTKGAPTGVYGATKLDGEQRIAATGVDHVIVRTAWLYSEFGKNFCRTMLALTASRPELKVVADQIGTPTYALDLARALEAIIDSYASWKSGNSGSFPLGGIYHFSDEGVCSWYDFAKAIAARAAALAPEGAEAPARAACRIAPCASSEYPSPVRRPAYSVLDKAKIKKTFSADVPAWEDSLDICLTRLLRP